MKANDGAVNGAWVCDNATWTIEGPIDTEYPQTSISFVTAAEKKKGSRAPQLWHSQPTAGPCAPEVARPLQQQVRHRARSGSVSVRSRRAHLVAARPASSRPPSAHTGRARAGRRLQRWRQSSRRREGKRGAPASLRRARQPASRPIRYLGVCRVNRSRQQRFNSGANSPLRRPSRP